MLRSMRGVSVGVLAGAMVALSVTSVSASGAAESGPARPTERITVSATGEQGNDSSYGPTFSDNGRFAAFTSGASNLVPGDTNGLYDIFVRDLRKGTVERVNLSSSGAQTDQGTSFAADISDDGRYVLFESTARNLVPWQEPLPDYWAPDFYVHDRRTGTTERVTAGFDGGSAYAGSAQFSANGRYVAFSARESRMENGSDLIYRAVYVHDRRTGKTERISNHDHPGWNAGVQGISADGRHVLYSQLQVRGGGGALWLHDRRTGTEKQVNLKVDGTPAAGAAYNSTLSADARRVAFSSSANDLVPGDGDGETDVFVRDMRTGENRRLQHTLGEANFLDNPTLSPDGRYLAYDTSVRRADTGYFGPTNVYLQDLRTGDTRLVSESLTGGPVTDEYISTYSVSRGGRLVGFGTRSTQLVPGDTNDATDGFIRRMR